MEEKHRNRSESDVHNGSKKASKKKQRRINNVLILSLFLVTAAVIIAMLINMVNVLRAGSLDQQTATVETNTQKTMRNDLYEIGNNPTEIQKEYFQELTDAILSGDKKRYAENLVKCFAADYFSWGNKDGNYEVGGLQYVYGQKYLALNDWTRWNYQEDFDLYLSKYGKNSLPIVSDVSLYKINEVSDFTVRLVEPQETFPCYEVKVNISYEETKVDLEDFCNYLTAYVVDNNGRMEIVELYAYYVE